MGRAVLPSISKIDDVLDLMLDPQKYAKYLSEFKSIYEETQLKLADLKTKEEADNFLSRAHAALLEADEIRKAAVKECELAQTAKAEAEEYRDSAKQLVVKAEEQTAHVTSQAASLKHEQDMFAAAQAQAAGAHRARTEELHKLKDEHRALIAELEAKRARLSTALASV